MIQLYHNGVSVCAQKVRLALAEADIAWESRHLNLRDNEQLQPAFLQINPKGQVPVLVDGAAIIIESTVINEYLVDSRECGWLLPPDAAGRARMRWWNRQVDDDVFRAIAVFSQSVAFRRPSAAIDREAIDRNVAAVPDEARRELKRSGALTGLGNPALPIAVRRLDQLLGDIDAALAQSDWLAGDALSLADIGLLPFVLRLDHLAMAMMFDDRPKLREWTTRMAGRPSFQTAVVDWLDPALLGQWRENGLQVQSAIASMREHG